jgi:hypothetical protein
MIREALDAYAVGLQRTFTQDRAQTVGASEVGQCTRKIFWLKSEDDPAHAAPRDEGYVDSWGARQRGQTFEDHFWAPAMRAKFGAALHFAGVEQRTFATGFLSATPDGLVATENDCFLIECKTVDPRTRLDGPKPEHAFQVQVQLGLVRELTEYQPTHAVIGYADSSFWNEVTEYTINFDPKVYAIAKARAAAIMTATSFRELKPEGWIAGGKECGYCPFTTACGRDRTAVPQHQSDTPPDPQFIAEIADLARVAKQLDALTDEVTAQFREVQLELRERLRAKGLRKVAGDGVTVTWSSVKGRPSYNMPAIREAAAKAGVDLGEYETVGDFTDRLVITTTPPCAA